ncbi:hypothetical protein DW841_34915, partial [Hungatella hathewayi]
MENIDGAVFDSPYCFLISQESPSCEIKTPGECALRAKEVWPLKRPRSGARVRSPESFVQKRGIQENKSLPKHSFLYYLASRKTKSLPKHSFSTTWHME